MPLELLEREVSKSPRGAAADVPSSSIERGRAGPRAWAGRPPSRGGREFVRSRARLLLCCLVVWALFACSTETAARDVPAPGGDSDLVVEMVFIVRVTGRGEDVRLEVPLPMEGDDVRIIDEELRLRGFTMHEVFEDGVRMAVLEHPALDGRRRFTYKARIGVGPVERPVPSPLPGAVVHGDLRRYTLPTPRLQSRSPLVRERLVEHLEPKLEAGEEDLVRMIFGMVAGQFERRTADGTNNVLRALREEHANDLGLDRLLITFLRAAGIPARNVGGFRLRTDGGRKHERWTEIHVGGEWVPMSVPKGWYGVKPAQYLRLHHGEGRLIERSGVRRLSFKVLLRELASEPDEQLSELQPQGEEP